MGPEVTTLPLSDRVLAEILSSEATLEAVSRVRASIAEARRTDEFLNQLVAQVCERISAERGAVLLTARNTGNLEPAAFDVDLNLAAEAVREHAAKMSDRILCVPMRFVEADLGVIYLESRKGHTFTLPDLHLLIAIANAAAVLLHYMRYIESLEGEKEEFQEYTYVNHGIVGESAAMRDVHTFIKQVAALDSTVLILGDSGTGKDLVARAIHRNSGRSGVCMAINCAGLSTTLLQSELFGHERGAFTGAVTQKKGKVEVASGGTLFLDEVAELDPQSQAALLRFVQEREFQRVGGTRTLHTDVRIVAATNRNLKQCVEKGEFREDLYYRLKVMNYRMPSLRERREDIPLLAQHFIGKFRYYARPATGFTPNALAILKQYDWPGNVRELQNVVKHAVGVCNAELIEPEDLPAEVTEAAGANVPRNDFDALVLKYKKTLIEEALVEANGDSVVAARLLGISLSYFHRLCKRFGVRLR